MHINTLLLLVQGRNKLSISVSRTDCIYDHFYAADYILGTGVPTPRQTPGRGGLLGMERWPQHKLANHSNGRDIFLFPFPHDSMHFH